MRCALSSERTDLQEAVIPADSSVQSAATAQSPLSGSKLTTFAESEFSACDPISDIVISGSTGSRIGQVAVTFRTPT